MKDRQAELVLSIVAVKINKQSLGHHRRSPIPGLRHKRKRSSLRFEVSRCRLPRMSHILQAWQESAGVAQGAQARPTIILTSERAQ